MSSAAAWAPVETMNLLKEPSGSIPYRLQLAPSCPLIQVSENIISESLIIECYSAVLITAPLLRY